MRYITKRQRQVLRLLILRGLTYQEAADELGISHLTVHHVAGNAYRILGVDSAMKAGIALGWIKER